MGKYGFTNNRQEINKKKAGEIQQAHPTDPELTSALKEKGGINWRNKLENLHKLLIYRSR